MQDSPRVLLVNPWIHDFAAYDFWAKPVGILYIAAILRQAGCSVTYIDCLDRFHPSEAPSDPSKRHGRGPYRKTPVPKPDILAQIPRTFSRYGIKPEWFQHDIEQLQPPDIILVTSLMTYWYTGVRETISILKNVFPETPVVLGGIYTRLLPEHAERHCGADEVFTGKGESGIGQIIKKWTGFSPSISIDPERPETLPYPAFDLQHKISCVPIITSRGCPYSCAYCASNQIEPDIRVRSPESVIEEIEFWHKAYDVRDFVFYDDALLTVKKDHAQPIFQGIIEKRIPIRFHTPNAMHIRGIDRNTATLLKKAGMETVRLGLETMWFDKRKELDRKVTRQEFLQTVKYLKEAGFSKEQVGAYLLAGLPGQTKEEILYSIETVKEAGITPVPAYYTPIPGTPLFEAAKRSSRYDLEADPLLTNNAIFPCVPEGFSWEILSLLKNAAKTH